MLDNRSLPNLRTWRRIALPYYHISLRRSCVEVNTKATSVGTISKVTVKYQTTIPREVREFLGVRQGDAVEYRIERGEVKVKRVTTPDSDYLAAVEKTLTEWDSAADNNAFKDL